MMTLICYNSATGAREILVLVEISLADLVREAWALQDSNTDHVYYLVEEVLSVG